MIEEIAPKEKSKLVWGASPAGTTYGNNAQPGTKEFFENVLYKRSSYEMPWLFELVPFASFNSQKVLELGCGSGYDAFEFCRNGSEYWGIDITPENIERARKHLAFYGFYPQIIEGDVEHIPFESQQFDVVFSNGVLHHTPDIKKAFEEAFRVLNIGGEFWLTVYHRNSVFYWLTLFLTDHIFRLGFLKRPFQERLAMIEYTTSGQLPLVNVYSCNEITDMLTKVGFNVKNVWVRKLVKEDLPGLPLLGRLYKYIPQQRLDSIGKRFGWYIVVKAVRS